MDHPTQVPVFKLASDRILSVDLAKTAAICAVLLIHCSADHYIRFEVGSPSWLSANFFGSVSRWAVSLFILCSGAIMNDSCKEVSLKKLFSKYFLRLFLSLTVWSILYEAIGIIKLRNTVPLDELLMGAGRNLLCGNTHYHLYFFWFIFAVYLVMPLTRLAARFASEQELRYLVLLGFLLGSIGPLLQYYPPFDQMQTSLRYLILPASFYCPILGLTGWYLRTHPPKRPTDHLALFLVGFAVTFGGVWLRSQKNGVFDGLYLDGFSPFVILMAIAVFQLCQYLAIYVPTCLVSVIKLLSKASFCIYLIHPLFQEALSPSWFLSLPTCFVVPIQWLMLMILSLFSYLLFRMIPFVRFWLI